MTAAPQKTRPGPAPIDVIIRDIIPLNGLVTRFEFARADGGAFPPFSGGAHTVIEMQDGDITRRNPYSLMSDPADNSHYAISVRRDDAGRGGPEPFFVVRALTAKNRMASESALNRVFSVC